MSHLTCRVGVPGIVLFLGTYALAQSAASNAKIQSNFGNIPVYFEQNRGQAQDGVRYLARASNLTAFLTDDGLTMSVGGEAVSMHLVGSSAKSTLTPEGALDGVSNYYLGARAITGVPHYAQVRARGIGDGIDLVYRASGHELEYDFIIRPGAHPDSIRLRFDAGEHPVLAENGDLLFKLRNGELRQHKPKVWQGRREIACHYALQRDGDVRLSLSPYDPSRELVIDPVLSYSTFLGGSSSDVVNGIAVDSSGYAYVTGGTNSSDFPVTSGTFHGSFNSDVFVTRLNPAGTGVIYSTFIGGNVDDRGTAIAINAGNAYITGVTSSSDFPITIGQNHTGGFAVELNSSGLVIYSNVLAGFGTSGAAIAVDSTGTAYVAGNTSATNFPATGGSLRTTLSGQSDAFVAKFSPTGQVAYATYVGGSASETGAAIAVDALGNAFIAGGTTSANFPATAGAFAVTLKGQQNAFVAELNPTGSSLVYATYLGGSGSDLAAGIALDAAGNCYVVGSATSNDFPTTANAFATTKSSNYFYNTAAFVSKLNATGTALIYSTYLGGSGGDSASGIAVDSNTVAYVVGTSSSADFPTTPGALKRKLSGQYNDSDIFLAQVSVNGSSLQYSTLLGSIVSDNGNAVALDGNGGVYLAGSTQSQNYPTTPGVFRAVNPKNTSNNGFTGVVSKIDINSPTMCNPVFSPLSVSIPGRGGSFSSNLTLAPGCPWEAVASNSYQLAITLNSTTHGMGSSLPIPITGTVPINNDTGSAHTGTVQVGTATLTVNQAAGSCQDPVISPLTYAFDAGGGIRNISLTLPSPCSWTATLSSPWLLVSSPNPPSGTGSASVTIYAPPNSFSSRSATLTIAGKAVMITQAGSACTSTASVTPSAFAGAGSTGLIRISTNLPNCSWTAYSFVPWIQLSSSASTGQGSGIVPFIVAGNPGTLPRSGQILIADQMVNINQSAGPAGSVASYAGSVFAGTGSSFTPGLGDGGPATSAFLSSPQGLAFDAQTSNLYIADFGNGRVRVVTPDGNINTLAGGGTSTGENVPPLTALLRSLTAVGVDNTGAVYVNDSGTRIRQIKQGNIATLAGGLTLGSTGDNGPATSALLSSPVGVAADANGNIYIADSNNNRVRKANSGVITNFAGNGGFGLSGDNGPATSAMLSRPNGIAVDSAGNLYIADYNNQRIRKVTTQAGPAQGTITTVAGGGFGGDGGPAISASLSFPTGVAFDSAGNLLIVENSRVRKIVADGTISTIWSGSATGVTADPAGNIYVGDYYNARVWKLAPVPSFCGYSVSGVPPQPGNGGPLTINVTATTGCNWSASSDLPWAPITSGTSGSGNGSVSLNIDPNAGSGVRSGTIVVAGQLISLMQNPTIVRGDFDGNAVPDLIWQNDITRQVFAWYMGGSLGNSFIGSAFLANPGMAGWSLVGTADFNGDGAPDLVWQNDTTGQVFIWYMGGPLGNTFLGATYLAPVGMPGWALVGLADLNADGHPDLIWHNAAAAQLFVWYMGGPLGNNFLGATALAGMPGWSVVGMGDLNSDGHPDVVWQNPVTGQVFAWYMGGPLGNTILGAAFLANPGMSGWTVVGIVDSNRDGTPDLLWQNSLTRQVLVWYMGGPLGNNFLGSAYLASTGMSGWTVKEH